MMAKATRVNGLAWDAAAVACILLVAVLFNVGEMRAHSFFFADDWAWLYNAEFRRYWQPFQLLPRQIYNDRPVGAVVIKALYSMVGVDIRAFHAMQLALHGVNGVLLYLIAKPYTSRAGALLAAVLAVTWMSANEAVFWTAAMFDLFGTTLCLLVLAVRSAASRRADALVLDLIGAAVLFLAIRTKEFALGLPALLLAWSVLLDRRTPIQAFRVLWPYFAVMAVVAGKYVALVLADSGLIEQSTDAYGLHADGILDAIGFYVSRLFYFDAMGPAGPILLVALLLFGFSIAGNRWRHAAIGSIGFLVLLGPVLLMPNQRLPLYLYAAHFLVAFAIGCLVRRDNPSGMPVALLLACVLIPLPRASTWHQNVVNFHRVKLTPMAAQFESVRDLAQRMPTGSSIYISGMEPYFNAFSNGPGKALMILAHDETLRVMVERPDAELQAEFCQAPPPRFFLEHRQGRIQDVSVSRAGLCAH